MSSFKRKMERKNKNKIFKDFKKSMKTFKDLVKCSICDKKPTPGETIDDWRIRRTTEKIDLMCVDCSEKENQNVSTS